MWMGSNEGKKRTRNGDNKHYVKLRAAKRDDKGGFLFATCISRQQYRRCPWWQVEHVRKGTHKLPSKVPGRKEARYKVRMRVMNIDKFKRMAT